MAKAKQKKSILSSRKWWIALIGTLVPVVNEMTGKHLDTETIIQILTPLIAYILAIAGIEMTGGQETHEK